MSTSQCHICHCNSCKSPISSISLSCNWRTASFKPPILVLCPLLLRWSGWTVGNDCARQKKKKKKNAAVNLETWCLLPRCQCLMSILKPMSQKLHSFGGDQITDRGEKIGIMFVVVRCEWWGGRDGKDGLPTLCTLIPVSHWKI